MHEWFSIYSSNSLNNLERISNLHAGPSGRPVEDRYCLRPLEHWGRQFESHSRYECVSAFFCIALSCRGKGLTLGWFPVEGVLQNVHRFINSEKLNSESAQAMRPNPWRRRRWRWWWWWSNLHDYINTLRIRTCINMYVHTYEGVSKSFRTGRLEREMQMI
jgi:hypothetical protein